MTSMPRPLVSVVIPAYNYADVLPEALNSVLEQGLDDLEIIVLDDASTDHTPHVMEAFLHDPRVVYVRQPRNLGCVGNINDGLRRAQGACIIVLSADDMLMPGYFRAVLECKLANPEAQVVYTDIHQFRTIQEGFSPRPALVVGDYVGGRNEFAALLAYGCYIFLGSALVDRELYERYGLFDAEIGTGGDLELLIRWAKHGVTFAHVARPLAAFRVHEQQLSGPQKYLATGRYAEEFLLMFDRHVTAETRPRLHGYEYSIMRHLQWKSKVVADAGFRDGGSLERRVAERRALLLAQRDESTRSIGSPALAIIVLAGDDAAALAQSMASLRAQDDEAWTAVVVSERETPEAGAAAQSAIMDDPRIRHLTVARETPEGARLNMALRLSAGEVFAFLRAGSVFKAEHVRAVRAAFSGPGCEIVLARPVWRKTAGALSTAHERADFLPLEAIDQSLSTPTVPLEALTVRRRSFDRFLNFRNDLQVLPEWEFFLRVRGSEEIGLAPHLVVEIDAARFVADVLRHAGALLPLVDDIHERYVLNDDRDALRQAYRRRVAALLTNPSGCAADATAFARIIYAADLQAVAV